MDKKLMIQKVANFSESLQFLVTEYKGKAINWKEFEDGLVEGFEDFRIMVLEIYGS